MIDSLPLLVPDACAGVAAWHGGTAPHIISGPGVWDGTIQSAPVTYGDAVAWAFVALLTVTCLALALFIRAIRMRPPGLTPEQALMEEVRRDEAALAESSGERPGPAAPWERDADWWRP